MRNTRNFIPNLCGIFFHRWTPICNRVISNVFSSFNCFFTLCWNRIRILEFKIFHIGAIILKWSISNHTFTNQGEISFVVLWFHHVFFTIGTPSYTIQTKKYYALIRNEVWANFLQLSNHNNSCDDSTQQSVWHFWRHYFFSTYSITEFEPLPIITILYISAHSFHRRIDS